MHDDTEFAIVFLVTHVPMINKMFAKDIYFFYQQKKDKFINVPISVDVFLHLLLVHSSILYPWIHDSRICCSGRYLMGLSLESVASSTVSSLFVLFLFWVMYGISIFFFLIFWYFISLLVIKVKLWSLKLLRVLRNRHQIIKNFSVSDHFFSYFQFSFG